MVTRSGSVTVTAAVASVIGAIWMAIPLLANAQPVEAVPSSKQRLGMLEYELAPAELTVLPFQTVRIRATIANVEDAAQQGIAPLMAAAFHFSAHDDSHRPWQCQILFTGVAKLSDDTVKSLKYEQVLRALSEPVVLEPHSSHSLSMPVVSPFAFNGYTPVLLPKSRSDSALFMTVGTSQIYLLQSTSPNSDVDKRVILRAEVECKAPTDAADQWICEEIRKNDILARFLSNPAAEADFATAVRLRELLKAPNSRYHNYLRFGLARAIIGSDGGKLPSGRKRFESMFEAVIERSFDGAKDAGTKALGLLPYQSSRTPESIAMEVSRAMELSGVKKHEDIRVEKAIGRLCDLIVASEGDVLEATYLLKSIEGRSFPFQPSVLILRRKIALDRNPPEASALHRELSDKYCDSLEWLVEQGMESKNANWRPRLIWQRNE